MIKNRKEYPLFNRKQYLVHEPESDGKIVVDIQAIDPDMAASWAIIALEEYERAEKEKESKIDHGKIPQQFIGLIGELAFKEALDEYNFEYHYYERKRNKWRDDKVTPDFKICSNQVGIEICTTPPGLNEWNHKPICSEGRLKRQN